MEQTEISLMRFRRRVAEIGYNFNKSDTSDEFKTNPQLPDKATLEKFLLNEIEDHSERGK